MCAGDSLWQGSPKFFDRDPQNKDARDWGPPWTPKVAYNVVHMHYNAEVGIKTTQKTTVQHYNVILK